MYLEIGIRNTKLNRGAIYINNLIGTPYFSNKPPPPAGLSKCRYVSIDLDPLGKTLVISVKKILIFFFFVSTKIYLPKSNNIIL